VEAGSCRAANAISAREPTWRLACVSQVFGVRLLKVNHWAQEELMGKRIEVEKITPRIGSGYPPPYDGPVARRERRTLGDAAGLAHFGVNLLRLPPGCWSSQRHWHEEEDELVFVVAGEVVLVTDEGEETLRAGDAAGFRAGDADAHHLQNRSDSDVLVLEIGIRAERETIHYAVADLMLVRGGEAGADFTHRDGAPY
jgi:uncharacterized cupin superfamily protein